MAKDDADHPPFALWDADADTAYGAPPDKPEAEPAAAATTLAGRGAMAVGGAAAAAGSGLGAGAREEVPVSVLSPVDVLFSQWFLDKDLVRLLFREKWLELGSGNGDTTVRLFFCFPRVFVCASFLGTAVRANRLTVTKMSARGGENSVVCVCVCVCCLWGHCRVCCPDRLAAFSCSARPFG